MLRIMVDFPEPDGPQMTIRLPFDIQVDVLLDVKFTIPFIHVFNLNHKILVELLRHNTFLAT